MRSRTLEQLEAEASKYIKKTPEVLARLEKYRMSERLNNSLEPLLRPSTARTSYSRISSQQISHTLNNILDGETRNLLAIQGATRNTDGSVNKGAVNKIVSASNASQRAQHISDRIGVLTTQLGNTQNQEELRREEKKRMDSVSEYDGGYAKLTKVGLLTRIMNIKKKAKVAKPTVRKAAKPVKKPAKPVARKVAKPVKPVRRKPTIVRRK